MLAPGAALAGVDVELVPGGARLAGEVTDATGGPVPYAHVRAVRTIGPRISLDASTDEAGRFELFVGPGFILVTADADGYAPARVDAVAPRAALACTKYAPAASASNT